MSIEQKAEKIITELYNNPEVDQKIFGILKRHGITIKSGINEDVKQVAFENLCKFDKERLVKIYEKDKTKILGLLVRIIIRTGVLADKRIPSGYRKSIGTHITHYSNLTKTDDEEEHDYSLSCLLADNYKTEEYFLEKEEQSKKFWDNVKTHLDEEETLLLDVLLKNKVKLKGTMKKEYISLLIKLKKILNNENNLRRIIS